LKIETKNHFVREKIHLSNGQRADVSQTCICRNGHTLLSAMPLRFEAIEQT
jgi:hypothetical protein